jgi:hypothetical protein
MVVSNGLHDARMIQALADLLLPLKTFKEGRVRFHFGMRNLKSYLAVRTEISRPKNGRRITASSYALNAVMIELVAWIDGILVSARERETGLTFAG